jgi:hypothetical protein
MPNLGSAHRRLAELEGTWIGREWLAPSPWSPGGNARAELTFQATAGGFAITQDYESETGLTGHGVFSAEEDAVLWHWFDSIGYPPETPARGEWAGDTLTLTRTSPRGTNRTTFALTGETLTQRIEFNGETLVEAAYARAP